MSEKAEAPRDPVIVAAFCAAVASRLLFLWAVPAASPPPLRYYGLAELYLSGKWLAPWTADQLPAAPLFFAACMAVVGRRPAALLVCQHLLGLATWALAVRAARRAGGPGAARWTAVVLALQLILPYEERYLFSEATAHFLLAAALNAALELRLRPDARPLVFALGGAAAGCAGLARGEMLVLGPVLGAALAAPGRGRASAARTAAFAAAWAVLPLGWVAHNRAAAGVTSLNPLGASLLIDYAMPLVRRDLPTHARAKALLRQPVPQPRLAAVDALAGDPRDARAVFRAQLEVAAVAREAIRSRPLAFAAICWENLRRGLRPAAWAEDALDYAPGNVLYVRLAGRERFWAALRLLAPAASWLAALLALALPLALRRRPGPPRWTAYASVAGAAAILAAVAPYALVGARLQSALYIPVCLAAGLSADGLAALFAGLLPRARSGLTPQNRF